MARELVLLTLEEFEELKHADFTPLDQLAIPQEEKDRLIEQALEKYGILPELLRCRPLPGDGWICFPGGPLPQ